MSSHHCRLPSTADSTVVPFLLSYRFGNLAVAALFSSAALAKPGLSFHALQARRSDFHPHGQGAQVWGRVWERRKQAHSPFRFHPPKQLTVPPLQRDPESPRLADRPLQSPFPPNPLVPFGEAELSLDTQRSRLGTGTRELSRWPTARPSLHGYGLPPLLNIGAPPLPAPDCPPRLQCNQSGLGSPRGALLDIWTNISLHSHEPFLLDFLIRVSTPQ